MSISHAILVLLMITSVQSIIYLGLFVFGTIIGSFLNVVILRLNTGRGLGGRSFCFSCGKTLAWHELVPILSFFLQKGKCRGCARKISWQYPIVEMLTGSLFVLVFWKTQLLFSASISVTILLCLYYAAVFSTLLVISVYDIRHKIIPDSAVFAFIILGLLSVLCTVHYGTIVFDPSLIHLVAGFALALPFAAIWFFSKGRLMGFGDAKLGLGIGFLLGVSSGVAAVMVAFWIGAIVGLAVLLLQKAKFTMKSEIPFAPFLALGAAIAFFASVDIETLSHLFTL